MPRTVLVPACGQAAIGTSTPTSKQQSFDIVATSTTLQRVCARISRTHPECQRVYTNLLMARCAAVDMSGHERVNQRCRVTFSCAGSITGMSSFHQDLRY